MSNRKYITRLNYPSSGVKGWWVRIPRLSKSKLFSDNIYGGTDEAELAARIWRDKQLKDAPPEKSKTADTGVDGLNVNFRRGKSKMLAYLSIDLTRNQDRLQATISLNQRPLRPVLWEACRRMAAFLSKYQEGDVQAIASDIFSRSYGRIQHILDKHTPVFKKADAAVKDSENKAE